MLCSCCATCISIAALLYSLLVSHSPEIAILCGCTQSVVNYDVSRPDGVAHWVIPLEDSESANLLVHLPSAVRWIEMAMRQKGARVLVHCNAGDTQHNRPLVCGEFASKCFSHPCSYAAVRGIPHFVQAV